MKLLEVKHIGLPPKKEPKLPEILRTKKGMEDFIEKWKKDMRDLMWEVWGNFDKSQYGGDYEETWYNFEQSIEDAKYDLLDKVPENMKDHFQTIYDELASDMAHDAREDFNMYNVDEDQW